MRIFIDEGSNIQDLSIIHVDWDFGHNKTDGAGDVFIGKFVTIGHNCIIHACRIEDCVLVGMGSVIMNGAVIGANSIIGANSLATKNKKFPPNSLIIGNQSKLIQEINSKEAANIKQHVLHYVRLAKNYKA